jgi:hypothetical protein
MARRTNEQANKHTRQKGEKALRHYLWLKYTIQ